VNEREKDMSKAAKERVLEICGSAVAERRVLNFLGDDDHVYVVVLERPYGQELGRGDNEPAAWVSAEKHILQSRYYRDDQGTLLRIDADQSHPDGSYRAISAEDFYLRATRGR
jgi:hypothetical protein